MCKSNLALLFLTIGMCSQRLSIAVGNIFLGLALLTFFIILYDRHKQGLPLFKKEYLPYYKIYGIFLLLLIPSVLFAGTLKISFKNFMEMWIYRFMPFVLVTNLDYLDKFWKKCFLATIVYVGFDGAVCIIQLLTNHTDEAGRALGLGDGYLRFSSILVTLLAVALVFWLDKVDFPQKQIMPLCAIAMICGGIGVQSRGSWVVSAGIIFIVMLKYLGGSFKKVAAIVLCLACIIGITGTSQHFRERFCSIDNITTDRSNGDRIEGWKSAWVMFQDKPVVGWGLNQSNEPYRAKYRSKAETQGLNHFHNNYVEMAVNTGVIGFIGYMFLVIGWLWIHRDWSEGYNVAISLAWLAFHAFGMIEYNVDLSASIKMLWFVMGMLACLRVNSEQTAQKD